MSIRYFYPAIAWGVLIFVIISMPSQAIPETKLLIIPHFDKLIHTTMFFVFSFLLCIAFHYKEKQSSRYQDSSPKMLIVFFTGIFYGGSTELVQHLWLEGRHGNIYDFIFNIIGVLTGITIYFLSRNTRIVKAFKFLEK